MTTITTSVPLQNRKWLEEFRRLKGYTLHDVADACKLSHVTYNSAENGGKPTVKRCTVKTISAIANELGVKIDMFYYRTDAEGRLIDKTSITDVLTLFASNGFKAAIYSENLIRSVFSPEVAEYIIDNIVIDI